MTQLLTALRHTHGAVVQAGGAAKVVITKELLTAIRGARIKYTDHLKKQKEEKSDDSQKKREHEQEISEVQAKIRRLGEESQHLAAEADKKAKEAEDKRKISLITESNVLREAAVKRRQESEEAKKQLEDLKKKKL